MGWGGVLGCCLLCIDMVQVVYRRCVDHEVSGFVLGYDTE